MNLLRSAPLLAVALAALSTPSYSQDRDACHDYANEMLAMDVRARQMKCPNWTNHSNYENHYDWCEKQSKQRINQTLADWGTRFQGCRFAAGGSPAAQADLRNTPPPNSPGRRVKVTSELVATLPPFRINKILEDGKWTRCAAEIKNAKGEILRIQINKSFDQFTLTAPLPINHIGTIGMRIVLDNRGAHNFTATKTPAGDTDFRARTVINSDMMVNLNDVKNTISVVVGTTTYHWSVRPANMENVLSSLESCTT